MNHIETLMSNKTTRERVLAVINGMKNGQGLDGLWLLNGLSGHTFYDTVFADPILEQEYLRAQTMKAEVLVEQIIEIADTSHDPQTARNRIDARRWYASKMQPHKYGDRIDLNVNQTVDIGSALKEAIARVPKRNELSQSPNSEPIDITPLNKISTSGSEPDAQQKPSKTRDADKNEDDDIFS